MILHTGISTVPSLLDQEQENFRFMNWTNLIQGHKAYNVDTESEAIKGKSSVH